MHNIWVLLCGALVGFSGGLPCVRGALHWSLATGGCADNQQQLDAGRNVTELIESRGFRVEEHQVRTSDGYLLTVFRLLNPLVEPRLRRSLRVVLLQHGLFTSAMDWLINSSSSDRPAPYPSPKRRPPSSRQQSNSLAFYLANHGYDVWLGNSRGNEYARRHVHLSSNDSRFWSFTFDEHSSLDLPATIGYVLRVTKKPKLAYVGHSQGAAIMLGLLADRPAFERFVRPFVALAPVAYVDHTQTLMRHLDVLTPVMELINSSLDFTKAWNEFLIRHVCQRSSKTRSLCMSLLFTLTGFDEAQFDQSRLPSIFCHLYSGTSVKNIAHYGQEVLSGRFAHFDHGILGNQMHYGLSRAPDYPLARIRSRHIALFSADNDWLASPEDVAHLRRSLTVEPMRVFNMSQLVPKWNHMDYIYAKTTNTSINPRILEVLNGAGSQNHRHRRRNSLVDR